MDRRSSALGRGSYYKRFSQEFRAASLDPGEEMPSHLPSSSKRIWFSWTIGKGYASLGAKLRLAFDLIKQTNFRFRQETMDALPAENS